MAAVEAMKEAIWLRGLVGNLGLEHNNTMVYCDSQSVIHLTKNQMYHKRTKHIDVRYHFIREIISKGTIVVKKIGTSENPANTMMKSITVSKFKHCLNLIGIQIM